MKTNLARKIELALREFEMPIHNIIFARFKIEDEILAIFSKFEREISRRYGKRGGEFNYKFSSIFQKIMNTSDDKPTK